MLRQHTSTNTQTFGNGHMLSSLTMNIRGKNHHDAVDADDNDDGTTTTWLIFTILSQNLLRIIEMLSWRPTATSNEMNASLQLKI